MTCSTGRIQIVEKTRNTRVFLCLSCHVGCLQPSLNLTDRRLLATYLNLYRERVVEKPKI